MFASLGSFLKQMAFSSFSPSSYIPFDSGLNQIKKPSLSSSSASASSSSCGSPSTMHSSDRLASTATPSSSSSSSSQSHAQEDVPKRGRPSDPVAVVGPDHGQGLSKPTGAEKDLKSKHEQEAAKFGDTDIHIDCESVLNQSKHVLKFPPPPPAPLPPASKRISYDFNAQGIFTPSYENVSPRSRFRSLAEWSQTDHSSSFEMLTKTKRVKLQSSLIDSGFSLVEAIAESRNSRSSIGKRRQAKSTSKSRERKDTLGPALGLNRRTDNGTDGDDEEDDDPNGNWGEATSDFDALHLVGLSAASSSDTLLAATPPIHHQSRSQLIHSIEHKSKSKEGTSAKTEEAIIAFRKNKKLTLFDALKYNPPAKEANKTEGVPKASTNKYEESNELDSLEQGMRKVINPRVKVEEGGLVLEEGLRTVAPVIFRGAEDPPSEGSKECSRIRGGSKKGTKKPRWSQKEIVQFYSSLKTTGTDFYAMADHPLFRKRRTRDSLKNFFKKQEKANTLMVNKALVGKDVTDLIPIAHSGPKSGLQRKPIGGLEEVKKKDLKNEDISNQQEEAKVTGKATKRGGGRKRSSQQVESESDSDFSACGPELIVSVLRKRPKRGQQADVTDATVSMA